MLSPRGPRRPVSRTLRSPSLGSPGRTPGRPGRRSRRAREVLRAAFMKKFSSAASAWVTSRPNSTSTPIHPAHAPPGLDLEDTKITNNHYSNNINNNNMDEDVMSTPKQNGGLPTSPTLPQVFPVKCLGWRESRGLWGVKHTRAPVDAMVAAARTLSPGQTLPRATLEVSVDGVSVDGSMLPIDCISYGVQDLVYTRVFCCVLVSRPDAPGPPFRCYGFVCESRAAARSLTYALASAFQEYSRAVKERQAPPRTVDLRTPEDIAAELLSHCQDSEA